MCLPRHHGTGRTSEARISPVYMTWPWERRERRRGTLVHLALHMQEPLSMTWRMLLVGHRLSLRVLRASKQYLVTANEILMSFKGGVAKQDIKLKL